MSKLLWEPSEARKKHANISLFMKYVNQHYRLMLNSYKQLYDWSIENIPEFWAAMWEFSGIVASHGYKEVINDLNTFPGAKWFSGARLNFAENLLRYNDTHLSFIFQGESKISARMTYKELNFHVARLIEAMRKIGVTPGDRVGAYMPNVIETAIAMLATTSIGAIWASCGAELGPSAVIDRLSQIKPKVLFTVDGYYYKDRVFNTIQNAEQVVESIPTLENVLVVPYTSENPDISNLPNSTHYYEFLAPKKDQIPHFEQLPFDHPVYIMFSSGTTGKPKCMVQSAGGVLINHLKELILHTDLKRDDRIIYITAPSWMMWNWLLSSLAVGATVVLYDGNPLYPDWGVMWRLVQNEKITIFGCSASYINYLNSIGAKPGKTYNLTSLREISQTASPLSVEGFEYIYRDIKSDIHFNSISGGTDINGCFAIGNPTLPVYAGELQAPALGMKVKAYNESGHPIFDEKAELVCEAPSPSMPIYFWDDPDHEKYKKAYFTFYTNKNVWRHGDYIIFHGKTGGITFYGRSDAVLKPSGIRIGTAEIYDIVEKFPEIVDSLAIGQLWKEDQRILLFVKLSPMQEFTIELVNKIKIALREKASPRHVPAIILETPDIPYTFSMKKVEIAVTNIIHGQPVLNKDALINPESLEYFEHILPVLLKK